MSTTTSVANTAPFTVTVTVTVPPPDTAASAPAASVEDAVPVAISVTAPAAAADSPAASAPPVKAQAEAAATAPSPVSIATTTPPDKPPMANPASKREATPADPGAAASRFEKWRKWLIPVVVIAILVAAALGAWQLLRPKGPGEGFVSSNGRIEATEIDVSTKFAGRLQDILVADGDFVTAGQTLAHMQVQTLEAQRDEARAQRQQSITAVATADAQVAARESDRQAVQAVVAQRESELDAAQRRLVRSETLTREGASSEQELDDDRARVRNAQASVVATKAQAQAAQANITAARAQVAGAHATVNAADATIVRIKVDIDDSSLTAPRDGRVQYRIAQPGEVLAGGGKVLNLIDLADVYMTFFVVETVAGKLALGSEVRIVLDAAPTYVIPAKISFVASTAQFTPKTVETASERQKLMFRVKAQINRGLLQKNRTQVKTGLPGMAWLKLDAQAEWPSELAVKAGQ